MAEVTKEIETVQTETVEVPNGPSEELVGADRLDQTQAAQGAVAVAAEAVNLGEQVAAEAHLAAADIVRRSVGDFERAFGELATWQGQTAERLQATEERQVLTNEAISSIQQALTALAARSQPILPEAPEIPPVVDPESGQEKDVEAVPAKRRHRFL
jgi:hypothetical protein